MGLFDKIFGRGASATVKKPDDQQKFNQLKEKYKTALTLADQRQVVITNFHLQDGKLYFKGRAPSDEAKNKVWDQIKYIDQNWSSELIADIDVVPQVPQPAPQAAAAAKPQAPATQTHTVQPGDTLSKISKQFYGDPDKYMRIFYANRDKLNDPDLIKIGQVLTIPPDDDQ